MLENIMAAVAPPKENRLFVFFHGLVCLVDAKKAGFIAYLLDMGNEHKCLCGDWLMEREIYADPEYGVEATLWGVNSGSKKLEPTQNAIVRVSTLPATNNQDVPVRAIIHLPRPDDIHHFVRGQLHPQALQGNDLHRFLSDPKNTVVSGTRVFQYSFQGQDGTNVAIIDEDGDPLWECPDLAEVSNPPLKVAAVHIYNEPLDHPNNGNEHTVKEFNLSLKLFGIDATLTNSATIPKPDNLKLPGVIRGEPSPLDERLPEGQRMLVGARISAAGSGTSAGGGGGSQVCGGVNAELFP